MPLCEITPANYKRTPRLEELRVGVTEGSQLFERVFENLASKNLKKKPRHSLMDMDENELCWEILCDLHIAVTEFPGISMSCYWLWDKAVEQARSGMIPDPSYADIYIKVCAMQRNHFRLVLQEFLEEDEELWQELMEKAGFPPEHFRSQQEYWDIIKQADEVLERARAIVLERWS